jgi:glycosyltransferase involved in cell wall biosynthesis
MSLSVFRNIARNILLLLPPVRRLHVRAAELGSEVEHLQQQISGLQHRLLDVESRNALILGLERQVEEAGARLREASAQLLESEARNALIPRLERQVEEAGARQREASAQLLESEARNALIPGLERQVEEAGARLREASARLLESEARNALIPGLERQVEEAGARLREASARLLGSEARNALIPGLERQVEEAGARLREASARLLESEARNALIPGLERQVEEAGARLREASARLLESEARNALIPGLERQVEEAGARLREASARLLESDAQSARVPALEEALQTVRLQLHEAEARAARIPAIEVEAADLRRAMTAAEEQMRDIERVQRAELAGANESIAASVRTIAELEAMQIEMHARVGELLRAEDRLETLPRGRAGGRRAPEGGGAKPLAIAMYGNTNNFPLLLAEGFQALGHEVRMVVNSRAMLDRPEAKYPAWRNGYPDWIFDCSSLSEESMLSGAAPLLGKVIERFFGEVDLVILNEHGPALSAWLPRPQLAFLTGSDLTYHANYDSIEVRTAAWDLAFKASPQGRRQVARFADYVSRQRDGILAADVVSYGSRGLIAEGDALLDAIGVPDARRMFILLADTTRLGAAPCRRGEKLRILNGARIAWLPDPRRGFCAQDLKGTDVLLRGFAAYCKRGGQGELRLFRKSKDVESAGALCDQLGIGERVVWLPEMPLTEFHGEMRQADLVCDQLAGSFPGMVTMDAYALGRPVLANFRNEILGDHFAEPLPGFQATTPDEVAEHLLRLDADRDLLKAMGKRSRKFAECYLSPQSMAESVLVKIGLSRVGKVANV